MSGRRRIVAVLAAVIAIPMPAVAAPGVVGGTILIGVIVPETPSVGLAGEAPLLGVQDAPRFVADHLNADGGIGGKRVVVDVFRWRYEIELDDPEGQSFEACQRFSGRAFAVVSLVPSSRAFSECLAANGTILIANGVHAFADRAYLRERGRTLYAPSDLTMDRWARAYVSGLLREGFLDRDGRIAFLHYAGPSWGRVSTWIRGELARHGIRLTYEALLSEGRDLVTRLDNQRRLVNVDPGGGFLTRFQAEGVDRILLLVDGPATRQVMLDAAALGYFPRYGLSTMNETAELAGQQWSQILAGSVGIGWRPDADVPGSVRPAPNAHGRRCLDILAAGGVVLADDAAREVAFGLCEGLFLLDAAAEAGGFGAAAFARGVASLGTDLPAIRAIRASGARPDGATHARAFHFSEGCQCLRYVGKAVRVS